MLEFLDVVTGRNIDLVCFIVPFVVFLVNVLRMRTSAGISQRFVAFSVTGAALLFITAKKWGVLVIYFGQFLVALFLFFAVRFKYHLKGERFRDPRSSVLVIPIAIAASLIAFYDADLRRFLAYLGLWLESLGLVCQVMVTKQSRRITTMNGYFGFVALPLAVRAIGLMRRAFTGVGSEMWTHWLNGMIVVLMTTDLSYYVMNAKIRNEDFDLPSGLAF